MSVAVGLDRLREELDRLGSHAFALTVSDDGSPHAVAVSVSWDDGALAASVGSRTAANARARPAVSLLWPAPDAEGFSLIVDGTADAPAGDHGGRLVLHPSKAVLHRARVESDGSTTSDCETVLPRDRT
jgi:hypothetical protein